MRRVSPVLHRRCAGSTYSKVGPAVVNPSSVGICISAWACAFSPYIAPVATASIRGLPLKACSSRWSTAQ